MGRDSAFGQRLAELRAEHGLSLRALGELAHYSRGYLWDLESGNKWPSRDTAARLDESLSAGGDLAALAERRPRPNHTVFLDDLEEVERRRRRLIASCAGDYHEALAYARDGQQRAPHSPHGVRLAINGEARALARLGDAYGVDAAVDRGFTLLGDFPTSEQVSTSMTLGPYCAARVGANPATAHLAPRQAAPVEPDGTPAVAAVD